VTVVGAVSVDIVVSMRVLLLVTPLLLSVDWLPFCLGRDATSSTDVLLADLELT
jgi:hypothetical protein